MCIKLKKEKFVSILTNLNENKNRNTLATKALSDIGYELDFIINPLEEDLVSLLSAICNDEDEWISWFLYEKDFGKNDLECKDRDGKVFLTNTPEQLYQFLINEPVYKKVKKVKKTDSCKIKKSK
jgi:hypothetical protein